MGFLFFLIGAGLFILFCICAGFGIIMGIIGLLIAIIAPGWTNVIFPRKTDKP